MSGSESSRLHNFFNNFKKEKTEKKKKESKQGGYFKNGFQAVVICEYTYYEWLKRGKKGDNPYSEFSELITMQ